MGPPQKEVAVTIIQLASEVLETPVAELPPLGNVVCPDALDTIVTGESPSEVTVTFRYAGVHVLVWPGKTVYVRPIHEGKEDPMDTAHFGEW